MSNPFDQFDEAPSSAPASNPFDQLDTPVKKPKPFNVLPLSEDEKGNISFDSNAGILGALKGALAGAKSAATLPGDVYTGKVDPNSPEGLQRAVQLASMLTVPRAVTGPGATAAPTSQALLDAGGAGFDAARGLGVDYSSNALAGLANTARQELAQRGITPRLAPSSFGVLTDLEGRPAGSTLPLAELDASRKELGHVGQNFNNPTDQAASGIVSSHLQDFMANPPANAATGPVDEAAQLIRDARANYAAGMRSNRLNGIETEAERKANAANSGMSLDNAIRSRAASLLNKPAALSGFSPEERAALEQVNSGTMLRNQARFIGNILGGGGGLGSIITGAAGVGAGAHFGGGPLGLALGAAVPTMGFGAKALANKLTSNALNSVDRMTRQRSPLFTQMLQQTPQQTSLGANPLNALLSAGIMSRGNQ